jgi:hypothetical protein
VQGTRVELAEIIEDSGGDEILADIGDLMQFFEQVFKHVITSFVSILAGFFDWTTVAFGWFVWFVWFAYNAK